MFRHVPTLFYATLLAINACDVCVCVIFRVRQNDSNSEAFRITQFLDSSSQTARYCVRVIALRYCLLALLFMYVLILLSDCI